ncbi:MAG TPA: hypothetical protein VL463_23720 [Kofleriaceae bacterium]|jgi:hypothetical protein|nr:hypothetical protein [Kofleriaceae bacterium]
MFAAVAMIACGSSKKTGTPDAKGSGSIDAPGGTVDAPGGTPDAAAAVTVDWNAAVCSQQTACALSGDECLSDGTSQSGFCGTQCGPTTQTMTPGTDYDTNCSSHYKGTGGTPACLFYSGTGTNGDQPPFTWYCAVACGTYMNMNLGTCPTGLTCKNFSGQTYGACQP